MDALDIKILVALMENSRIPLTQLAKKVRASREVVNYRINRLVKEGIILKFVTEINLEKLGFIGAAVFVSIRGKREKEFKDFLERSDFVSWVAELSGTWNFGLSIYGRSNEEINKRFFVIYNEFKEDILDHRFNLHSKTNYFYEKYFGSSRKIEERKEAQYKPDNKDKTILRELSKNSRLESVELSKKLNLTAPAVSKRIRQLEKSNYIERYLVFVDISKLGLMQYSVFLANKNIESKNKLISYLSFHKSVSFVAEYIGDPFIEIGVIVKSPYDLRNVLREIEESFPDNRITEISLFQKEIASIGSPLCVFG